MGAKQQDSRGSRAGARRDWPVRKRRLGEEPGDDLSAMTTAKERLAMMWPLALEAWSLTGRPMPNYERQDAPIRRLARGTSK